MAPQTYEECVAKKLELDKQLLDIENQVKKKEAEYNLWGGCGWWELHTRNDTILLQNYGCINNFNACIGFIFYYLF